jgi:FK506-binding nuclear protein
MKYPEFEQDSDDEEDEEEEEDEDDENIKLPKIITKEPVLAVLRPDAVRSLLSAVTFATLADRVLPHAVQIEQASINVTLVEDVEVVEFSVTGEKCVRGPRTLAG